MRIVKNIGIIVVSILLLLLIFYVFPAIPLLPAFSVYLCGELSLKFCKKSNLPAISIVTLVALLLYGAQLWGTIRYYPQYGNWLAVVLCVIQILAIIGAFSVNAATARHSSDTSIPEEESSASQTASNAKPRFCKYCGSEYSKDAINCPQCGHRLRIRFSRKDFVTLLLVLSLCANAALSFSLTQSQKSVEAYKDSMVKLSHQSVSNGTYKSAYMRNYRYVAIVTPSGKKYHTVHCSYLDNCQDLYIYSVDGAKAKGYEPCSVCHPSKSPYSAAQQDGYTAQDIADILSSNYPQ